MSIDDLTHMMASYRDQYGQETEALFGAMLAPQEKLRCLIHS